MMRSRTPWDWRLKLYPFTVIPWIFYVTAGGSLTPSRTPEASGGHSVAAPFNVAAKGGDSNKSLGKTTRSNPRGDVVTGAAHPNNAARSTIPFNVTAGQERERRMGVEANPQGLSANDRTRWGNNASSDTVEPRTHALAVTPQTAAFPDRTCFYGRYPLESFCFVLTQERG